MLPEKGMESGRGHEGVVHRMHQHAVVAVESLQNQKEAGERTPIRFRVDQDLRSRQVQPAPDLAMLPSQHHPGVRPEGQVAVENVLQKGFASQWHQGLGAPHTAGVACGQNHGGDPVQHWMVV
jgi:hypothetical protein